MLRASILSLMDFFVLSRFNLQDTPIMIPILLDGPASEPLSLAEAKTWLKLDAPDEDDLIRALIIAARLTVEAEIGQVLMAQNWRLIADAWPGETLLVRIGAIITVIGARVFDASNTPTSLPLNAFTILPERAPAALRISMLPTPGRAKAGIEIDLRLGFGETATDVPEPIRLAIRQLVALWFEHRGDAGTGEGGLPASIRLLLQPFRRLRL